MNRICLLTQEYEAEECTMIDFALAPDCDPCGDLGFQDPKCPTVVVPGRIASCISYSCIERDSPLKPYATAVPVLGGKKVFLTY